MKLFGFLFACLVFCQNLSWADQNNGGADKPFVVIELFGSEGCSSCPPADELLREFQSAAKAQGKNIFTLSFHVDYWDYLGWVDPFSQAQFTQRQYEYARVLKSSSVYTPQMIINGTHAFVGSNKNSAQKYVDQHLEVFPNNKITLSISDTGSNQIEVSYQCQAWTADTVLNIALVEDNLKSNPTRGENAGRQLKHANVVREFKTISFKQQDGKVLFAKPKLNDLNHFSIIAYLQKISSMEIIAAEGIDLSE